MNIKILTNIVLLSLIYLIGKKLYLKIINKDNIVIDLCVDQSLSNNTVGVETIIKEVLDVCASNSNLNESGVLFLTSLIKENEELFFNVYELFNEERRNKIYKLAFSHNNLVVRYLNNKRLLGKNLIKKLIVVLLKRGLHDTTHIKTTELPIKSKGADNEYRILFLADLQLNNLIQTPEELHIIIENTNADILILGGDIIDEAIDIPKIERYLDNISIPYKYYVRGNHEYYISETEYNEMLNTFEILGFEDINNKNISFPGFNIIGIDDITTGKDDISLAYTGLNMLNNYNLVVTHNHDVNYKLDDLGYSADLILSGHTHGGQVVIPFQRRMYRGTKLWLEQGFYKGKYFFNGKTKRYLNYTVNGLGGSRTPLRINAQQEILVIHIFPV